MDSSRSAGTGSSEQAAALHDLATAVEDLASRIEEAAAPAGGGQTAFDGADREPARRRRLRSG